MGSYELVTTATADDFVDEDDGQVTRAVRAGSAGRADHRRRRRRTPTSWPAPSRCEEDYVSGSRQTVRHTFRNDGPTQAGFATVEGSLPAGHHPRAGHLPLRGHGRLHGGELLGLGHRLRLRTLPRGSVHLAPRLRAPLLHQWSLPYSRWVEYDVIVPAGAEPVEATATIVGRNDPDLTNNASVVTVQPPASSPSTSRSPDPPSPAPTTAARPPSPPRSPAPRPARHHRVHPRTTGPDQGAPHGHQHRHRPLHPRRPQPHHQRLPRGLHPRCCHRHRHRPVRHRLRQ